MDYDEFKFTLARADLRVQRFAELLGKPTASVTNYSKVGRVPDHLAVIAVLMARLREAGVDFEPLVERMGLQRKRGRGAGFDQRRDDEDE